MTFRIRITVDGKATANVGGDRDLCDGAISVKIASVGSEGEA